MTARLTRKDVAGVLPAALLVAAVMGLYLRRALHGMWILPFVDETGHILGARVLEAGGVLYRDFVDAHGPLAYAVAEMSDYFPGLVQPGGARATMIAAMLATATAVAASPCLRGASERLCSFSLCLGLSWSLWLVQGLCMLNYQPLAGMLLAIAAAQFTFCAWRNVAPSRAGAVAAGAAIAIAPCAGYSYAPAACLLAASGVAGYATQRNYVALRQAGVGACAAFVAIAAWMLANCDIAGFIADHFILNQFYFSKYIDFHIFDAVRCLWPIFDRSHVAQDIEIVAAAGGVAILILSGNSAPWTSRRAAPVLIGIAAVILTNPRASGGFQSDAFAIVGFAAAALAVSVGCRKFPSLIEAGLVVAMIAAAEICGRYALSSPDALPHETLITQSRFMLVQKDDGWARRLRRVVTPSERMLVLPIQPNIYFDIGRLPMPGFNNYFPWDGDFARGSRFGRSRDLCQALALRPPPLVWDDDAAIWGSYKPSAYIPCVDDILAKSYFRMKDSFFYIRNDRSAVFAAAQSAAKSARQ
jgi:hypothetical protein